MRKSLGILVLTLLMAVMAVSLLACGKKGLPTPPRYVTPPVVRNVMVGDEQDDVITLNWLLEANGDNVNLSYFNVYMERQALSALCLTCPPNFVRIGESGLFKHAEDGSFSFKIKVEEGYRYVFMVRGVGREGLEGADSNYTVYQF